MVFGSFSKERFPDARSHHQSSRPQIAFQEDTNTVETLINHGRGRGSLVQQGHWSSRALLAPRVGRCVGRRPGRPGSVLSRHCLARGGSWALAQPVKWAHIHMGQQCPAQARPRPCLALACAPANTLASWRLGSAPRGTEGPVHFPVAPSTLQEFRSWEKLGRGGATSGCGFKDVCFHSSSPLGLSLSPQGKEGSFANLHKEAGAPDPIYPHLLLPGAQRGFVTCLEPQPPRQTSAGFPSALTPQQEAQQAGHNSGPISGPPPGANT